MESDIEVRNLAGGAKQARTAGGLKGACRVRTDSPLPARALAGSASFGEGFHGAWHGRSLDKNLDVCGQRAPRAVCEDWTSVGSSQTTQLLGLGWRWGPCEGKRPGSDDHGRR